MRVWIDMTASAHPLVFRPLVARLHARGDDVEITARDYAQTLQLMRGVVANELAEVYPQFAAQVFGAKGAA